MPAAAPAPRAEEVVPAAPEPEASAVNEGLLSWFGGLFGGSSDANAEAVDTAIDNIETRDPAIDTSAGAPPLVPLEGATDLARLAEQQGTAVAQTSVAQDAAGTAVIAGPGPELVQPMALDEPVAIGPVEQPPLDALPAVDGIEQFEQAAVTEDVQAAFDQQNAATMQASLAAAEQQVTDASAARDTAWDTEIERGQAANQALIETAQEDQTAAVEEQRTRIEDQQQDTLDQQAAGVAEARLEADTLRQDQQEKIDTRVAEDEAEIEGRYAAAEQEAATVIEDGERRADAEKAAARADAENESWWDQASSAISAAVGDLVASVTAIIDQVGAAVSTIIDGVRDG